jgi:hypothetical protein
MNETNTIELSASTSSGQLLEIIESNKKEIIRLKKEISLHANTLKQRKKESSEVSIRQKRISEYVNYQGVWLEIAESGIKAREIFILMNPEKTTLELSELWCVSKSRINQIRHSVRRKMLHPRRKELAEKIRLISTP